jgi:hypothetical protein
LTSYVPMRSVRASFNQPISLFSIKFCFHHETHLPTQPHQKKT